MDTVGRIGGEEFQVVAPETNQEGAISLAERIREAVATTPIVYGGQRIKVTVSIGFAVADSGVEADFEQMKHVASAVLAEAKGSGELLHRSFRRRRGPHLITGRPSVPVRARGG